MSESGREGVATKTSRHAWISSTPIDRNNIHARCNLMGRKRWLQENNILKEKHQGYSYEHIFSHNWNAMKGYHSLMHIACMLKRFCSREFGEGKTVISGNIWQK
ncbi:MAG: hypothetical protein KGZ57_07510 [Dethiobacter sp.]|nr:hypothetical protein [Dethiobacter sp.]